jgi:outer membrane biosynthesis protein TonB
VTHTLAFPLSDPANWHRRDDARSRRTLSAALALSLLLHAAVVWEARMKVVPASPEADPAPAALAPLTAALAPARPQAESAPTPPPPPPPQVVRPAPRPPPSRAPVMTAERAQVALPPPLPKVVIPTMPPIPEAVKPLPSPPPPAAKPPQETQTYADLSAYVAARRRARGEPDEGTSTDGEVARRNRIVAANLAAINTPTFGAERRNSGGMFQITHLSSESAEFTFFGWNQEIKRRASQRIDVRRENHPDIKIAVVRRMIAIIREYEQEDFTWRSNRLGRDVTLSARAADTEGLEQFMLREFF